jgi:hypothetical protein
MASLPASQVSSQALGRAEWTPPQEQTFLQSLVDSARAGQRAANGFKPPAWTAALNAVNEEHGVLYTYHQLRNKYEGFRKYWRTWERLTRVSGWSGITVEAGASSLDEDTWHDYVRVS